MTRIAILIACFALSGCAGLTNMLAAPADTNTVGTQLLQHIELCDRSYQGAIGAGVTGFTGSFNISCKAQERVVPLSKLGDPPV